MMLGLFGRDNSFRQSALVATESSLAALQSPKKKSRWPRDVLDEPCPEEATAFSNGCSAAQPVEWRTEEKRTDEKT